MLFQRTQDFITSSLPVQESIFRIFLANGNEPLTLAELSEQLSQRRGIDSYRASSAVLSRLMANDQHYGLRPVDALILSILLLKNHCIDRCIQTRLAPGRQL